MVVPEDGVVEGVSPSAANIKLMSSKVRNDHKLNWTGAGIGDEGASTYFYATALSGSI